MTDRGSRAWTFTINNYTDDDVDRLLDADFVYLCFGFEEGKKKKTPHIQGYIYYKETRTESAVHKSDLPRASLHLSKGTTEHNQIYTSKEGKEHWYQFGEPPSQGRAKWELVEDVMADPKSNIHLFNQYHKSYKAIQLIDKFKQLKKKPRVLYILPISLIYTIDDSFILDGFSDISTYRDEQNVVIRSQYQSAFNVEAWYYGHPPRFRLGYEVNICDPTNVYLCYDDAESFNYLRKRYDEIAETVDFLTE